MGTESVKFLEIHIQTGWRKVLADFAAWCAPQPGWATLDVGCGPGLLPALLGDHGCRAIGVDLTVSEFASERLHPTLLQADVFHLPFADGLFDLVTATNLLFLLDEPALALRELKRVTRPNGQVALLNPSEKMSWEAAAGLADQRGLSGLDRLSLLSWAELAEIRCRWGEPELCALFNAAGLSLNETALRVGPGLARFARGRPMYTPSFLKFHAKA